MLNPREFRRAGARGLALLLGVAVAGVVIPASPAAAAVTGSVRISATSIGNSSNFQNVTATCPTGKVLIGTGYEITGATGEVVVDDLRPNGSPTTAPTAVTVGAYETDDFAGNWSVTAYAICSNPLPGLVRVSAAGGATSNAKTRTVTCPAGKVLTGGGFEIFEAAGAATVDRFVPNGDINTAPTGLSLTAYETDPFTGAWSLTGYAICADPVPGLRQITATSAASSEDYRTRTATCPANTVLTSGGFEIGGGFGEVVVDDFAPNGGPLTPPTANVVGAYEEDPYSPTWDLTAIALCATR